MEGPAWERVAGLFREALVRPAGERRAFLDRVCGADRDLFAKVTGLLDAAYGPDSPTACAPAADGARSVGPGGRASEGPGSRIGPYKLLQEIGAGGFGAVYLAEQEQPVRRKVALKVIKLGMDTRQVIARFEAERQALAMMEHANIAKVLDAGATDTGRPYFVMELVRGVPLTEYCDTNQLTTRQRLELFIPICEAVQHAHQKGIIHRDLKPSNVLVTIGDGKPIPKVIDFGIAKATDHRLTEKTLFTEHRQLVGTPEYMSPEQAEMHGLDVDTRTDVYSLGVLLYELLTGTLPFDPAALRRAGREEIERIIRETEPPKPSTRVSRITGGTPVASRAPTGPPGSDAGAPEAGSSAALIARRRQTDPASLRKQLRGDLDWITLKALEKDRTRRYGTASELAQDVRRHLEDEPVLAGPPSGLYRLRKLARRHRVAIGAGSLVLLALVAGLVLATYGLVRASAAAASAHTEQAKAEQTAVFLKDMLAGIDPDNARGRDTTLLREVLDGASERVARELADQPEVAAGLRLAIGTAYESIGLYEKADPHLRAALEARRERLGPERIETAEAMVELAYLDRLRGKYQEAEDLYVGALAIRERELGPDHPETAACLNGLGVLRRLEGQPDDAQSLLQRALDIRRRVLGPEHVQTLTSMNNLAVLLRARGRYAEAESLYKAALDVHRRTLGEEHPTTFNSMSNLGTLYTAMGRYADAGDLLERALAGRERMLGPDHPDTLLTVNNLASLYRSSGRAKDAEPLARRAYDARVRAIGPEHPDTLTSMVTLGGVLADLGRYDEAVSLQVQAVEARTRTLGDEHQDTLSAMNNLATTYFQAGRYTEALALHERSLEVRRRTIGEDDPDTVTSMFNVGTTLRALKRYAEAEPLMTKALEARRRQRGPEHPGTINALTQLGLLDLDMGRNEQGAARLAEAVSLSREKQPQGKASFGNLLSAHGKALTKLGKHAEAEAALLEAYNILHDAAGESHKRTLEAARALADLYEAWGKADKAAQWRAKAPGAPSSPGE